MGVNSSKKEILQKLQIYKTNQISQISIDNQTHPKIEYQINQIEYSDIEEIPSSSKNEKGDDEDSYEAIDIDIDFEEYYDIHNPKLDIKEINWFPYNAIGTINVQFPLSDEIFIYTCFLIDSNVVVTLASNLENKNKGGKAKLITTSFSKDNIKWENIFIEDEEKKIKEDEKDKNKKDSFENLSSKLAVIIYGNYINNEWLGVENEEQEYFEGRDKKEVFSLKEEKNNNIITISEKENINQSKLRRITVNGVNPFLDAFQKGEYEDIELIKQSPGSPVYYQDYNGGAYVIAIINEFFQFQYFNKNTMHFLANMVNKGRKYRIEMNKGIDQENIIQLNLEKHNLGALDIKYLNTFDFKNLTHLNLNSNSIDAKGAFFLSQGKFSSLEFLNLSYNKIGDEGLNHISNGNFSKLNSLHLSRNYITSEGIRNLVKAEFIKNLTVLSLSDNRKIGDTGIRYIKEHKGWGKLTILNLDLTGLTDISLTYLREASMPKLKELNIIDNKFTENGKASFNAIAMNKIKINYKI